MTRTILIATVALALLGPQVAVANKILVIEASPSIDLSAGPTLCPEARSQPN